MVQLLSQKCKLSRLTDVLWEGLFSKGGTGGTDAEWMVCMISSQDGKEVKECIALSLGGRRR